MSILSRLNLLKIFIGLVRNPQRTELIFKAVEIASRYKEEPIYVSMSASLLKQNEFRELYDEKYLPAWPSLEELRLSAEGSFARALYDHLNSNGLDLDLFPRYSNDQKIDAIEYLNIRAYQDHDLWHALLGYTTELEDELGLQGFSVAQFGSPLGVLLIAGGLLHLVMKSPLKAANAIRKIAEGYRIGERTRFLLGMKLIDMLPLPLEEVRALAGVPMLRVA